MYGVTGELILIIMIDDPRFTGWALQPCLMDESDSDCGGENGISGLLVLHGRYSGMFAPKLQRFGMDEEEARPIQNACIALYTSE